MTKALASLPFVVCLATAAFAAIEYENMPKLFNDLVQCAPTNVKYRDALSDSFEQQGYQSETMAWRNSYLQGANELRTSQPKPPLAMNSTDILAVAPTEGIFDMMAVRLNATKAVKAGLDTDPPRGPPRSGIGISSDRPKYSKRIDLRRFPLIYFAGFLGCPSAMGPACGQTFPDS